MDAIVVKGGDGGEIRRCVNFCVRCWSYDKESDARVWGERGRGRRGDAGVGSRGVGKVVYDVD